MTTPRHSRARAIRRLVVILGWTVALLPPSLIGFAVIGRAPAAVLALWHRGCCRVLGLTIETSGEQAKGGPLLFTANHVSYLDILVLGGMLRTNFIAKAEVRDWPAIGWLARLSRTVFVERRARSSRQQRDAIVERLAAGERLVLFAEGTSSDGGNVLPFKSALFSAIGSARSMVDIRFQPVTIDYARFRDGRPIGDSRRAVYAWYGDMTLMPHLWNVLGLPGAVIKVHLHDVIDPDPDLGRKELATMSRQAVADGLLALRAA